MPYSMGCSRVIHLLQDGKLRARLSVDSELIYNASIRIDDPRNLLRTILCATVLLECGMRSMGYANLQDQSEGIRGEPQQCSVKERRRQKPQGKITLTGFSQEKQHQPPTLRRLHGLGSALSM